MTQVRTSSPQLRRWLLFGFAWISAALLLVACPTGLTPLQEGSDPEGANVGGERQTADTGQGNEATGADTSSTNEPGTNPEGTSTTEAAPDSSVAPEASGNEGGAETSQPESSTSPDTSTETDTAPSPDEGKLGDTCTTACDCTQGLDCQQGKCVQPSLPIYCCDKPLCPKDETCITRQGSRGQCPAGPSCTGTCDCPQGQICLNGGCRQLSTNVYCCDKAGCPEGGTCFDKQGTQKTCSKAGQPQGCKHTCDCSQGLLCIQGTCVNSGSPVYCCDSANCPAGRSCVWRVGGFGNCKPNNIQCKSACDCKTGETCYNGACIRSGSPTYCCARKDNCPSGQLCQDEQGTLRICGSGKTCRNNCDCPAKEQCFNGSCIGSTQSVLPCCTSQTCPQGQLCVQTNGSFGTCP